MKLWIKIYIFSLVLIILTLNLSGFILIDKFHKDLLKKEIEKCIEEEKFVSLQLKINSLYVKSEYKDTKGLIKRVMNEYNTCFNNESSKIGKINILNLENKAIYSDVDFINSNNNEELENLKEDKINYVIRTVDNKKCLYICSLAYLSDEAIKIYYVKDISEIYDERVNRYLFFIKLNIVLCLIFAVFMIFISKFITKSINSLINSTNKISSGEYSERVSIKSKDEFYILAKSFNTMAQTIEDKIRELEESNVEKETFINNFTHELKTPLTSIIGYANLIRTSKYNEELFFEAADYIYKQGKRLEIMELKLMDLIYAKTQKITLKPINIINILEEIKDMMFIKLNDKNIKLIIGGQDCILKGDSDLIKILLCNLIENAMKASECNSKIKISIDIKENKLYISIRDYGIGIPKEHLEKIFQPFYVVDKSRSRKLNGAGIGLSICEKIIRAHNADININSELGKGTEVVIIFEI